jgi:hypothetical protein
VRVSVPGGEGAVKGDRVEIVVDAGEGTRTYEVSATRAGRRVEVSTGRGIVEVTEVTRTGTTVRTARFMASRVIALVEHPVDTVLSPLASARLWPLLCFPARLRALVADAFPRRSAQTASLLSPGTGAPFGSRAGSLVGQSLRSFPPQSEDKGRALWLAGERD